MSVAARGVTNEEMFRVCQPREGSILVTCTGMPAGLQKSGCGLSDLNVGM